MQNSKASNKKTLPAEEEGILQTFLGDSKERSTLKSVYLVESIIYYLDCLGIHEYGWLSITVNI